MSAKKYVRTRTTRLVGAALVAASAMLAAGCAQSIPPVENPGGGKVIQR